MDKVESSLMYSFVMIISFTNMPSPFSFTFTITSQALCVFQNTHIWCDLGRRARGEAPYPPLQQVTKHRDEPTK